MSSAAEKEMDQVEKQFEEFDAQVKAMTMDSMKSAPKEEKDEQTKLSQKDIQKSEEIYLKPVKTLMAVDAKTGQAQKFNEKFREDYNFAKEYVQFIAENNEIKGEVIDIWTRPYGGIPAEEWLVPVNKPIWGPRYLAEQIRRKSYHVISMSERSSPENFRGSEGGTQFYGQPTIEKTVQRLDARPVATTRSVFMGK